MHERNRPPDLGLNAILEPIQKYFESWKGKSIGWILLLVIIGIWAITGIYKVGPGERGVVLTFGRLTAQTEPGLRYRFPWPVQTREIVDIAGVRRAEIGFRTVQNPRTRRQEIQPRPRESLMLSGDENIVDVQLIIQYLVRDPALFLYRVREARKILHSAAEVALRSAVGQNTIDFTMTEGRVQVQDRVKEYLQRLLDEYETGLLVTEARLLVVDPPEQVRDAFHDVVRAWEDRERLIREAEGFREEVVPRARGEAAQMVLAAEAYRQQRLIRAQGDAARFLALLEEYRKAPGVTRERLYLETMERVLPSTEKFVLAVGEGGSGVLPFLPLRGLQGGPAGGREKEEKRK